MGYQLIRVKIEGICPTLMNNGQKSDPTNIWARLMKEINAGRGRGVPLSDDKLESLLEYDFYGSLYPQPRNMKEVNAECPPAWPAENIESMLFAAAKTQKQGKMFQAAVMVEEVRPLGYKGPKVPRKLFDSLNFRDVRRVKVGGKTPMLRCRPRFDEWTQEFTIRYILGFGSGLDPARIRGWLDVAALQIGLSDWHPKFGRFQVVAFEPVGAIKAA